MIDTFAGEAGADDLAKAAETMVLIDSKFETMFTEFDKDKNGEITKDEMIDFLVDLFGVDKALIDIQAILNKRELAEDHN